MLSHRIPIVCVISVVLLLLFLAPMVQAEESLRRSGTAVVLKGNVEEARNKALAKAFQKAVEHTLAGLVGAEAVEAVLEELGIEDPLDYVQSFRILADHQEGNLYRVEVEAQISQEMLKHRLVEMGLARDGEKPQTLAILVHARVDDGIPEDYKAILQQGYSRFAAERFRARGFKVIAGKVSVDDSLGNFEKLRLSNRLTAMQGRRLEAAAVVLGLIEMVPETEATYGEAAQNYGISLWVRAIQSDDEKILAIREDRFSLEHYVSPNVAGQLIEARLDGLIGAVGVDIRNSLR